MRSGKAGENSESSEKTEIAFEGHTQVVAQASTCSMVPAIAPGDWLVLSTERPQWGDVAWVGAKGCFVTHRMVGSSKEGIWLQADAGARALQWISHTEVWGRVAKITPGVRGYLWRVGYGLRRFVRYFWR